MSQSLLHRFSTARAVPRLLGALVAGAAAGLVCLAFWDAALSVLVGIAVCAGVFEVWGLRVLWPMDAEDTAHNARSEDFPGVVDELGVLVAALAALTAVWVLIIRGEGSHGVAALALLDVLAAWACVHLMYAVHYAVAYYADPRGGIDFNNPDEQPAFRDFIYFSYNLGMTYQVSDTAVTQSAVRQVVLRQSVISWLFGTAIVASTINFVIQVFAG